MSGSLASRRSRRFCLWPLHASQARFIHLAVSRDPEKPFPAKPSASKAIESSHQTIHAIGMGNSGNKTHQNRHRKERGRKKFFFFSSLAGSLFPTDLDRSSLPLSERKRNTQNDVLPRPAAAIAAPAAAASATAAPAPRPDALL